METIIMNWYLKLAQVDASKTIIAIYGTSSGGDNYPATDPAQSAEWFFFLKPEAWQYLVGKQVIVKYVHTGSYHERWFGLYADVQLDNNTSYLIEDEKLAQKPENYFNFDFLFNGMRVVKNSFIFNGIEDAISQIKNIATISEDVYSPNENETSEEYWARMIKENSPTIKRPIDPQDTYKEQDNYFKNE